MAANFRDFQAELNREIQEQFLGRISQVQRFIALQGLRDLVFISPVVSGMFRSNWMTDAGRVNERTQENIESPQATINRGQAIINRARPFQPITIHNSLPYAVSLNEGHARRLPAGWVEAVAARLQSQFRTDANI